MTASSCGGATSDASPEPLSRLNLRQKSATLRLLLSMMWLVILPAFTIWSLVGTKWVVDVMTHTPQCLPGGAHFWSGPEILERKSSKTWRKRVRNVEVPGRLAGLELVSGLELRV